MGPGRKAVEASAGLPLAGSGEIDPGDPFHGLHFSRVRSRNALVATYEYRTDLVFDDAVELRSVAKVGQGAFEFDSGDAEFLVQTSVSGVEGLFAPGRMTAAGVGPDARPGFFGASALLGEHASLTIEKENGESAVEGRVCRVHRCLFLGAGRMAVGIEQDDAFRRLVGEGNGFGHESVIYLRYEAGSASVSLLLAIDRLLHAALQHHGAVVGVAQIGAVL